MWIWSEVALKANYETVIEEPLPRTDTTILVYPINMSKRADSIRHRQLCSCFTNSSFTLQPVLARPGSAWPSTDKHTVHTINSATELCMRNTHCYASTATVVSLLRVHTPHYKLPRRIVLQMADQWALLAFCELPTRRTLHSRQRARESGMLQILRSRRTFTTRVVLLLAIVSALYTNALLNTARPRVVWTMPR